MQSILWVKKKSNMNLKIKALYFWHSVFFSISFLIFEHEKGQNSHVGNMQRRAQHRRVDDDRTRGCVDEM